MSMSENKKIFLLRITNMAVARHRMNLLYITAGETSHYILVKDLSRLVLRQYSNHDNKKYFYQYCLNDSTGEEVLRHHLERCKLHETHRIKLSEADDKKCLRKLSLQKQNTHYVYLLSSMQISKVFYIDKTRVNHRHQNILPPSTRIMYHVRAAST